MARRLECKLFMTMLCRVLSCDGTRACSEVCGADMDISAFRWSVGGRRMVGAASRMEIQIASLQANDREKHRRGDGSVARHGGRSRARVREKQEPGVEVEAGGGVSGEAVATLSTAWPSSGESARRARRESFGVDTSSEWRWRW